MALGRRAIGPSLKADEAKPKVLRATEEGPSLDARAAAASERRLLTHRGAIDLQRLGGNQATRSLIQTKLTVGPAGDRHEQEADRVAKQVMRALQRQPEEEELMASRLQRQPEEEELMASRLQRQPEEEELMASRLQRQGAQPEVGMEGGPLHAETEDVIRQSKGRGKVLDAKLRRSMEAGLGTDFSRVRVHDDGGAHHVNEKLQSKAFTSGNDIFFRKGAYDPTTPGGQELVAHELTHVVQQSGAHRILTDAETDGSETSPHQGLSRSPLGVIRRIQWGRAPKPAPSRTWWSMGGFDSKHVMQGDTVQDAKEKWKERYKKDTKGWVNTVVSQKALQAAIDAGDVQGSYPPGRTGRAVLTVKVSGYKVRGRKQGSQSVPGTVTAVSQIGLEGSGTETLFHPDHLDPATSK